MSNQRPLRTGGRRGRSLALVAALFSLESVSMAAVSSPEKPVWNPRDPFVERLAGCVRPLLDGQDRKTGRFGTTPWISTDQNVLFPLAVAWATKHPKNPWHHDRALLGAIMQGGDALVDAQDARGMWTFRKKDGSTWGQIAQPWTYSRWVRAFALIKGAMPAPRRAKWERGLRLGYTTIARTGLRRIHNIPCHHAMGLYCAGEALGRDDWKKQAKAFLHRVVRQQHGDGYWSEHRGPVVLYNYVYSEALGCYAAMSGDRTVLPALRRAARFHAWLTYPDGTNVETVDERNPYHPERIALGNAGFTLTPEGRGFLIRQRARLEAAGRKVSADAAAQILLHGEAGPAKPLPADAARAEWTSADGKIAVLRAGPWFLVGSAHTAPVSGSRWIQDRQNFLSVFHDKTGLIVGGGNTKLQPYWSSFAVGNRARLRHRRGDAAPTFVPPSGLTHVPSAASLKLAIAKNVPGVALALRYGAERAAVRAVPEGDAQLRVTYACRPAGDRPVHGHLTLIPHVGRVVRTGAGASAKLGGDPIAWTAKACGGWIEHAGWRLTLPAGTRLLWPRTAHNPYRKTGHSALGEARLVVEMPFDRERTQYEFALTIP